MSHLAYYFAQKSWTTKRKPRISVFDIGVMNTARTRYHTTSVQAAAQPVCRWSLSPPVHPLN